MCFVFLSGRMFLCCPYAYSALVSAHVCISQYIKCAYLVHMLLLSVFQSSTLLISCSGWALVDLTVPRIQIAPYSCVSLRHWGREETLNHHPSPYIYIIYSSHCHLSSIRLVREDHLFVGNVIVSVHRSAVMSYVCWWCTHMFTPYKILKSKIYAQ